jgi:hypothetical protein
LCLSNHALFTPLPTSHASTGPALPILSSHVVSSGRRGEWDEGECQRVSILSSTYSLPLSSPCACECMGIVVARGKGVERLMLRWNVCDGGGVCSYIVMFNQSVRRALSSLLTLTYTPPSVPHTQKVLWLQAKDKRRPQDHCLLRRHRSQEASTTPQGCPRRCAREVLRVREPLAGGFGGVHCAGYWFRFGSGLLRWYVFFGLVMGSEEMSRASQALRGDKGAKGERYICMWKG